MTSDFVFNDFGTIGLLLPCTEKAHDWITDCIADDAMFEGESVIIEHRYIGDILYALVEDGFVIDWAGRGVIQSMTPAEE